MQLTTRRARRADSHPTAHRRRPGQARLPGPAAEGEVGSPTAGSGTGRRPGALQHTCPNEQTKHRARVPFRRPVGS